MDIIIDSGSTKCDLVLVEDGAIRQSAQTNGINPFYQTSEEIFSTLEDTKAIFPWAEVRNIWFYGAGCAFPDKCQMVGNALRRLSPKAVIEVTSDLVGAARSLFKNGHGIACILGTGSNSCYYENGEIAKNVPPLGFILGDEGSGAAIGKRFVGDILKGIVPLHIAKIFFEESGETAANIMDHVYKQPFPNRYLAQFAKYVGKHLDEDYFRQIALDCFHRFFERDLRQYPPHQSIRCIGSVAYNFKAVLAECAEKSGHTLERVDQSPLTGLVEYHSAK